MARIHEVMPVLMRDIGAVGKDHRNEHHKYKYRSVDDLMSAVYQVLVLHKVTIIPRYSEPTYTDTAKGVRALLRLELDWYAEDGSVLTTVTYGEGTDTGDKSAYKCMAGALKYALLQTLCIPTEETTALMPRGAMDPEADSNTDRNADSSPARAPMRAKKAKPAESLDHLLTISSAKTASDLSAFWASIRPELVQMPADSPARGELVAAYKKKQAELG